MNFTAVLLFLKVLRMVYVVITHPDSTRGFAVRHLDPLGSNYFVSGSFLVKHRPVSRFTLTYHNSSTWRCLRVYAYEASLQ